MTPAHLQTIEEIFRGASALEPVRVSAYLEKACNGNETLRRKVEALLASRETAANFIETSAAGLATRVMQRRQAGSLVGQVIGHYKISHPIGTGGMGDVYLATDTRVGRKAALKLLPTRFAGDSVRLQRFQQEAHAVTALNHPNILTVYEIGEDGATSYIASELIEGETLRQRLQRGRIPLDEAVEIATQVAGALAAAHDAGIIHRDIKPENIMLRPDGYVKVLDFGIAKLAKHKVPVTMPKDEALLLVETNLGSVLGTVRYMSPEQACGAPIDKHTDIWSLGVVLYEMVTQHAPFAGDTPKDVMSAILRKEPPPLTRHVADAPPVDLQLIISKALRKDRSQRYHSAQELLQALKDFRHNFEVETHLGRSSSASSWRHWVRSRNAVMLGLLAAAFALALPLAWNRNRSTTSLPGKSIAVLPFENLSKDEENAFFALGVQDEILTDLAKVADLKVISRTSVMKYKTDLERKLPEIAKALGVSYLVEGSVQRAGGRVRVNVQLIDARSDAHLWAEDYDRDVADVFAIQSEIARQIADQLRAKLSPAEKVAIAERPTTEPVAYAYYTKAKEMDLSVNWEGMEKSSDQKVELLEKAIQRDPNFALAYCELAKTQVDLSHLAGLHDQLKCLELAKNAAETAVRLRPDLGEAHLGLARYYFELASRTGRNNYDRAREELAIVRRKLPNNAEALVIEAMIGRHENRWDTALANMKRANELDPHNSDVAFHLWQIYFEMRRYSECGQILARSDASGMQDASFVQNLFAVIKLARGDPVGAQSLLEQVPLDFSPGPWIWDTRFTAALYLRDYDAANRIVAATPAKWAEIAFDNFSSDWAYGQVARVRGDKQRALAAFAAARQKTHELQSDKPEDAGYLTAVAKYDAGLGRKEDAIREARRAVALMPISKDSLNGPPNVAGLALVYAWTGERALALTQLEIVAKIPAGPTYGDLLFNPCWDDLRGEARFKKILAAAKAASR